MDLNDISENYLTIREACDYLGITRRLVLRYIQHGRIAAIRNPLSTRNPAEWLIERESLYRFAQKPRARWIPID